MKRTLLLAALATAVAAPAAAHVVLAEREARAGGYEALRFRVGHGCGTSPTVSLTVQIAADVAIARPQPKPGWTLTTRREPLPHPATSEMGDPVRDRVAEITWTGRLDADQFDEFAVFVRLPQRQGRLFFPTIQRCESGESLWVDTPMEGQPVARGSHPAPSLMLTAPAPSAEPMPGMSHH